MIQSVQVSRGLAAIAVAVYHVYLLFLQKFGVATFEGVAQFGYLGVPYFFVLSGFIIAHAHWKDLGKPERLKSYAWRRFTRLYPVYWIFTAGFVLAAMLGLGDAELDPSPLSVLENILLIHVQPDFIAPPLKVAWTLFYEVRFYLLFALAIVSPRVAVVAAVAWGLSCLIFRPFNAFTTELLSYWSFAFMFGVAAALGYRRLDSRMWPVMGAVGLVLCASIFLGGALELKDKQSWLIFPVSAGFACVVLALAMLEKVVSMPKNPWGVLIGDASYSIYLVHSSVIAVAVVVLAKLGIDDRLPHWLLFFPVLIGSVAAGVIAHIIIERPLMNMFRRRRAAPLSATTPA